MMLPTELEYPLIAIGDTHGRVEWLQKLVDRLKRLPEWPDARLIFLGDFVDRCDTVSALLDLVIQLIQDKPGSTAVMGNHDLALLGATGLGHTAPVDYWVTNYGMKYDHRFTFRSYLNREPDYHSRADWVTDLAALRAAIPEKHQNFLKNLPWGATAAGHLFLHCGLSHELALSAAEQVEFIKRKEWVKARVRPKAGTDTELLFTPHYPVWVGADRDLAVNPLPHQDLIQVSGHERVKKPDVSSVRIRIDTSGGTTKPLTGCLLRGPGVAPEFIFSHS